MPTDIAYEDAVDLLDSDHKLVQKLFIQYETLKEFGAPAADRQKLAERICAALTVHAQIEEEIFYPAVREATGDDALLDHAEQEHQEAKDLIARIQGMSPEDEGYDDCVKQLAEAIMSHVMEERERVFLEARYSSLDLRGLAVELYERKQELKSADGGMPDLPVEKTPEQIEEHA
jgi:hemerythrin superfamily protein